MWRHASRYLKVMAILWTGILLGSAASLTVVAAIVTTPISDTNQTAASTEWIIGIVGFAGTILGALISAAVSYQIHSRDRTEQLLTSVHSIRIKASIIYSDLMAMRRSIEESIENANRKGLEQVPMWLKVIPVAGLPQPLSIKPEELIYFAKSKNYELLQDLSIIGPKHHALIDALHTYNSLRIETEKLLPVTFQNDEVLGGQLTQEEYSKLLPSFIKLDSLLVSLRTNLEKDIEFVKSAHDRISPSARQYFGIEQFPIARAISEEEMKKEKPT